MWSLARGGVAGNPSGRTGGDDPRTYGETLALAGSSLGELLLGRPVDDERRALGEQEAVQEEVVPPRSRGARCRGLSSSSAQAVFGEVSRQLTLESASLKLRQ